MSYSPPHPNTAAYLEVAQLGEVGVKIEVDAVPGPGKRDAAEE